MDAKSWRVNCISQFHCGKTKPKFLLINIDKICHFLLSYESHFPTPVRDKIA